MQINKCLQRYNESIRISDEIIKNINPDSIIINSISQLVLKKGADAIFLDSIPLGVHSIEGNKFSWFYGDIKGNIQKDLLKIKALGIKNNIPELSNHKILLNNNESSEFLSSATGGNAVARNSSGEVYSSLSLEELLAIALELYDGYSVFGVKSHDPVNKHVVKIAYVVIKDEINSSF
jgi:hypothetical protein